MYIIRLTSGSRYLVLGIGRVRAVSIDVQVVLYTGAPYIRWYYSCCRNILTSIRGVANAGRDSGLLA